MQAIGLFSFYDQGKSDNKLANHIGLLYYVITSLPYGATTMIKTYSTNKLRILFISLIVLSVCELFFLFDVIEDITGFGIPFLGMLNHTMVETFATLTLGIAIVILINNIRALLQHQRHIEESVQAASGHLHEVIKAYFKQWKLTPSEEEVAMLLFKGYSAQEIADLRETKIGTVKNQSSSIYQKAEVKNRNELFSLFVEELLVDANASNNN